MSAEKLALSAADYVLFSAALLASAAVGVYFQFAGRKGGGGTTEEYLLAGRGMSAWPVALSLMATFMSATNIMGLPADIYAHGTNMAFMNVGFVVGPFISAYLFLPVYFNSHFTTAYEYLEKRFGRKIRRFVSATFVVQMGLFTAATLYAPALALSAVTDLSLWMSVIAIGTVCTFYCTLGGMKAVLWTDVFQAVLMYTTLVSIIAMGCHTLDGLANIFQLANEGGRLVFPSLRFDLSKQYTIYNIFAQAMILILSSFGGSQVSVQRLMAVKSLRRSRFVTFLFIPMLVSFQLLCCMCGLVFYAYFRSCDPMTSPSQPIHSVDQLMPFFVTSTMSHLPGLPGLCIAGIFSASLSTVSSAINSLAAVTYEDFLDPLLPAIKNPVMCTKIISFVFGSLCVGLSFVMSSLGNLLKLSVLLAGMFAGPNLAVFLLASCTTAANEGGAMIGLVAGLSLGTFLNFGPGNRQDASLPVSTECALANHSLSTLTPTVPGAAAEEQGFHLAYMWYSTAGLLACLIVGYFSSIVITLCSDKTLDVPELYLSPVRIWFSKRNCHSKLKVEETTEGSWKQRTNSIQRPVNCCDSKF